MEWVLDNLENVIVPIIILILYGLGNAAQGKKKKAKRTKAARRAKRGTDEARRAQDIREEIQRKIRERMEGPAAPPPHEEQPQPDWPSSHRKPLPVGREMSPHTGELPEYVPSPAAEPVPPPLVPVPTALDTQFHLEDIEAELRRVRALEANLRKRPEPVATSPGVAPLLLADSSLRGQLFRDLAHPLGQRKAILVSEILGKPLGLKGPANRRAKW